VSQSRDNSPLGTDLEIDAKRAPPVLEGCELAKMLGRVSGTPGRPLNGEIHEVRG